MYPASRDFPLGLWNCFLGVFPNFIYIVTGSSTYFDSTIVVSKLDYCCLVYGICMLCIKCIDTIHNKCPMLSPGACRTSTDSLYLEANDSSLQLSHRT